MAPIFTTFTSVGIMAITLSTFYIPLFLILNSFINVNLQGLIYLAGLIFIQIFGYLSRPFFSSGGRGRMDIQHLLDGNTVELTHRACNLIDDPWYSKYSAPSFHAIHHSFTLVYLMIGPFWNGIFNAGEGIFLTFLILLFICDWMFRTSSCVYPKDYLMGMVVGLVGAVVWFSTIYLIQPSQTYGNRHNDSCCPRSNSNGNSQGEKCKETVVYSETGEEVVPEVGETVSKEIYDKARFNTYVLNGTRNQ